MKLPKAAPDGAAFAFLSLLHPFPAAGDPVRGSKADFHCPNNCETTPCHFYLCAKYLRFQGINLPILQPESA